MQPQAAPLAQRRKYIRLDSVFPVQFRFLSPDKKNTLSGWMQGFTSDICDGGICLKAQYIDSHLKDIIIPGGALVSLAIEMPVAKAPIPAIAQIIWVKKPPSPGQKYELGLRYDKIDPLYNTRIMRFARMKKMLLPALIALLIMLGIGFAVNSYFNLKLLQGNKVLIEQLVKVLQDTNIAKQKIKELRYEKGQLKAEIQALEVRIELINQNKDEANIQAKKIAEGNLKIEQLSQDKAALQEKLIEVQAKENAIAEELVNLDKKKAVLEKANLDRMYRWLIVHQNPRSGLVMSFEGDSQLTGLAFTYDQSLVIQAYTMFGDFERAKKILEFYLRRARRQNKMFVNAYYVSDGSPAEYTVHTGPNLWLGMAALRYSQKSQDKTYLPLAKEIAEQVMALQEGDPDRGLRGSPDAQWFSTEHNLDGYAFFTMLYEITGEGLYKTAAKELLGWLSKYAYGSTELPIKRGKGDSTIATDTYAWSISALGPEQLEKMGMNPDKILEFAENTCAVEVEYLRPEGNLIKIKGFDFAPQQHLARGGIVSTEWTAQMILSFKQMARYYHGKNMLSKARFYESKADEYLAQLGGLIISSPSPTGQGEGCLPYATEENVDTGHGWITPRGRSTGSIAGTTFALFAYYNYNPLKLEEQKE